MIILKVLCNVGRTESQWRYDWWNFEPAWCTTSEGLRYTKLQFIDTKVSQL